jgi:hypothetical protein
LNKKKREPRRARDGQRIETEQATDLREHSVGGKLGELRRPKADREDSVLAAGRTKASVSEEKGTWRLRE